MRAVLVPPEGSSRASKPSQELPTLFLPELLFTPFIFQKNLQYLGARRRWTRKPPTTTSPPQRANASGMGGFGQEIRVIFLLRGKKCNPTLGAYVAFPWKS